MNDFQSRAAAILFYFAILGAILLASGIVAYVVPDPAKPFDSNAWITERQARTQMVDSLLRDDNLIGLTYNEVELMLGMPDASYLEHGDGRVLYWVEQGFIDDLWLELQFQQHKVASVVKRPD